MNRDHSRESEHSRDDSDRSGREDLPVYAYARVLVDLPLESELLWEELQRLRDQAYESWKGRRLDLGVLREHDRILRAMVRDYLDASVDALEQLDGVEALFSGRAKHTISLAGLLEQWSRFVIHVEEGYEMGGDDYANDLDTRELIHEILAAVTALREKTLRIVRPWDARFQQATVVGYQPLGGGSAGAGRNLSGEKDGRRWWYWREPKYWPGREDG